MPPASTASWRYHASPSAGECEIETDGKEDALYSPFLRKPFARAIADGLMPADLTTIAGMWGPVHTPASSRT